jgi:hypothetical protein
MTKRPFSLLGLVIVISMIVACNKVPKHAQYIPKDVMMVGTINMKNLSQKLIWSAITGSDLFEEMQKNVENEESKAAMKDISNIGLDQLSTAYFYFTGDFKTKGTACVVLSMKDAGRFEKFVGKNYPQAKVEDKGTYKWSALESGLIAAWNKEAALFFPTQSGTGGMLSMEEVQKSMEQSFNLKKDQSVASLEHFNTLQGEDHDMSFWLNYESMYQMNAEWNSGPAQAFMKPEYFKDAALATGIDFEKGSVDAVMDYYMSKELSEIYTKFAKDANSKELVENLPSGDVAFLMSYQFKAEMIKEFLAKFKLDGLADIGLMAVGTSMGTLTEAFNGDMVIALTDMKKVSDSVSSSFPTKFEFFMAMKQNDPAAIEKLLNMGIKNELLIRSGNDYKLSQGSSDVTLVNDKKYLTVSTRSDYTKQFLSGQKGPATTIPKEVMAELNANPFTFYVNMQQVLNSFPIETSDPDEKALMDEGLKMFTYAEMHGGKMKKGASHMEGQLNFTNKSENALIQIIHFAMKAKKLSDKKKATATEEVTAEVEEAEADSSSSVPQ